MSTNALARDFEATLSLSPGYNSVRAADPALIFHGPFVSGLRALVGPDGALWRASVGTLASAIAGRLDSRDWHIERPEYEAQSARGLLLEAARTNKCLNFNAAPDEALTGLTLSGDPSATLQRTLDIDNLREAGLELICPSGYVLVVDNRNGVTPAYVAIAGEAGNTIIHTASVYWRGQGGAELRINGTPQAWESLTPDFCRMKFSEVPDVNERQMTIHVNAGSVCYWILNQFEENHDVASSVIETLAVATSRDNDQVRYAFQNRFNELLISHEQGMYACDVTFEVVSGGEENPGGYTHLLHPIQSEDFDPPKNQLLRIIHYVWDQGGVSSTSTRYEKSDGSAATISQSLPVFPPRELFTFALRWNRDTGALEQGVRADGIWSWASAGDFHQWAANDFQPPWYGATFASVPGHLSNVRHWSIDRGRAWLEANA